MSDDNKKTDNDYINLALDLAAKGYGRVSPNPYVGAIIVKNGQIIGQGFHNQAGAAHAEIHALNDAGSDALGATLYVTLEPCSHTGLTPPCVNAIINAGIIRVVSAMEDPNPRVQGQGHARLKEAGIEVVSNIKHKDAAFQNRIFIYNQTNKMPYVTLKAAMSLDGKIATQTRDSKWITGEKPREQAHFLRGLHDAILIGKGTLIADDPELTVRYGLQTKAPIRLLVISNFKGIDPQFKLFNTAQVPTWIFYPKGTNIPPEIEQALLNQGVELIALEAQKGQIAPQALLDYLYTRKVLSVMLEGGAYIYDTFLNSDLINEYALFYGPKLIGNKNAPSLWDTSLITDLSGAPNVTIYETKTIGESVFIHALNHKIALKDSISREAENRNQFIRSKKYTKSEVLEDSHKEHN